MTRPTNPRIRIGNSYKGPLSRVLLLDGDYHLSVVQVDYLVNACLSHENLVNALRSIITTLEMPAKTGDDVVYAVGSARTIARKAIASIS